MVFTTQQGLDKFLNDIKLAMRAKDSVHCADAIDSAMTYLLGCQVNYCAGKGAKATELHSSFDEGVHQFYVFNEEDCLGLMNCDDWVCLNSIGFTLVDFANSTYRISLAKTPSTWGYMGKIRNVATGQTLALSWVAPTAIETLYENLYGVELYDHPSELFLNDRSVSAYPSMD